MAGVIDAQQLAAWEQSWQAWLQQQHADVAHDLEHTRRVVAAARRLAVAEAADLAVVLPAAWLHDCVVVAKDSPLRAHASAMAAEAALARLQQAGYPHRYLAAIGHAIEAHSFSAGIVPQTIEARVVQDADRLDALGAVGLARCLMLGATLGRRLYDPDEPFPTTRQPDDLRNTIDHFYTKLLGLADTMTTTSGRDEARQRSRFLHTFLDQLRSELGA